MYYSRQQIKFSLKEWKKISKFIFSKSDNSVAVFENEIKIEFGQDFKVVTGSSMRDLLRLVIKYYIQKTRQKEVTLSKYNHFSNLNAIILAGGKVVFEGNKSKIKIITQLHGIVKEITETKGKVIIEDGAHAFGASFDGKMVGTRGVGVFSFGLGKIVTGFGGGAVVSKDKLLISYIRKRRKQRSNIDIFNLKMFFKGLGYQFLTSTTVGSLFLKILIGILLLLKKDKILVEKSFLVKRNENEDSVLSMTEMQAEVGRLSLKKYKEENDLRLERAREYNSLLKLYSIKSGDVFFHFPVKVTNVDRVKWEGWKNNLDVQLDYCENVEKLFDGKEEKNDEGGTVYFPTNPEISLALIEMFVNKVNKFIIKK